MSILAYEKETHISMGATSDKMRIFTTEKHIIRKLDKYVENSEDWTVVEIGKVKNKVVSKIYEAPRKLLLMREHKLTRVMTDEQKAAAAQRLKAARDKKNQEAENVEEDFGADEETMPAEEGSTPSSAAGENPRLEPQKTKPKIVKVKSVIAEMDKER